MAEYIEREKLLEILKFRKTQYPMEEWQKNSFEGGWQEAVDQIEDDVKNVPTTDVVSVTHGHWIEDGDVQICSECGEEHSWQEYRASYCEDRAESDTAASKVVQLPLGVQKCKKF